MQIKNLNRFWINQPSTLQPDHKLHGALVLAAPSGEKGDYCDIYFTSGETESQRIAKLSLSKGWPSHLTKKN